MQKLLRPIENFRWHSSVSQMFGVSRDIYYPRFGIPGHNGLDIVFPDDPDMGYGRPVRSAHAGKVVQVFSDFPTKTIGTGIYLQKKLDDGRYFETVYWHLSDVHVRPGDEVNAWEIIGKVGNTGFVLPKPSSLCPYCGSHLHFACRYVGGNNEYGGWIDPTPLLFSDGEKLPVSFKNDLYIGRGGDDVSWLQTILKIEGFAEDYEPIGHFGRKTLRDVIKLQKKYNITPSIGYVGKITRSFLNDKYSIEKGRQI